MNWRKCCSLACFVNPELNGWKDNSNSLFYSGVLALSSTEKVTVASHEFLFYFYAEFRLKNREALLSSAGGFGG